MKKLFAFILVLVLATSAVCILAACNNGLPPFELPANGYDGSAVTITFMSSMGQDYGELLDEFITRFKLLYPNITVEHDRGGDYDSNRDLIKTKISNNKAPNLAFCYSDHVALYNRSRAVVTLDDLINSQIVQTHADGGEEILGLTDAQKADFIQTYYNEGKSFGDGKMYMLPFAKSTELMYYNKTAFDKWGLTPPDHWFASDKKQGLETEDTTSMEYALAFILDKDPECTPLGVDSGANWLITLFEQFETGYTKSIDPHYEFDNEDNYDILTTLTRWYQKGYFTTRTLLDSYTSTMFVVQDSYMSIGSSAGAGKQVPTGSGAFDVGVTMIPQKEAGMTNAAGEENFDYSNCRVISQGPSVCIFNSKNPQEVVASWLLAKYLITNLEFQARYGVIAGYLPVLQSVQELDYYAEILAEADTKDNMAGMAALKCLEYRSALFTSPAFYGSSEARDQMEYLLENCCVNITSNDPTTIANQIKQYFKQALEECEY